MDFVLLFFVCLSFWVVGVVSGWRAREEHANKKMRDALQEIEKEMDHHFKDHIFVNIEQHNGVLFCYDKKTNAFMAQANNKEELEKKLHSMFPGKRFAASQDNLKEIGF